MQATTIQLPQFPDANVLTHSAESTFKTCQRRFFLRYKLGLVPSHDSDALRIGSAFHLGLEHAKAGADEAAIEKAVRGAYADHECPPWLEADEFAVEEETAVAMCLAWHRRWKDDLIIDYVAMEQSFDLPIVNPATGRQAARVRNRGKIDGIARLPDGRLALVEHKTTGEAIDPGSDYWRRLQLDSQISRYFRAAQAIGFAVDTTVYDVTRKPQIRPKAITKADRAQATHHGHYYGVPLTGMCPEREAPRMYGARLLADMAERPDHYFARMEIPRLAADLDEFATEQWVMKNQIRECELEQERAGIAAWPRNTGACTSPYKCQYLDVCRGMRGDPTQELPNGFKIADRLHPEVSGAATA